MWFWYFAHWLGTVCLPAAFLHDSEHCSWREESNASILLLNNVLDSENRKKSWCSFLQVLSSCWWFNWLCCSPTDLKDPKETPKSHKLCCILSVKWEFKLPLIYRISAFDKKNKEASLDAIVWWQKKPSIWISSGSIHTDREKLFFTMAETNGWISLAEF